MDTKGTELDLTHRKNFYLIFKESINNAAKYSGCTQVEVQVKKDEGHILLRVKDNGRGFDQARIKKGHGLRNMEERAKDMGAMIEVSSTIGCGTTVQLKVRLT
jgi:signal transduction histidine kinase